MPGRSFVEYMLEQGFDVYLLDWGSPGPEDQGITFDDYVTQYLRRAVRKVRRISGSDEISMLGYCIGATLAVTYTAVYPESQVRNLILLTAPIDFEGAPEGSMAIWLEEGRLDIDIIESGTSQSQRERIKAIRSIIKDLAGAGEAIEHDDIIAEAEAQGIERSRAESIINRLRIEEGWIYEPRPGSKKYRVVKVET